MRSESNIRSKSERSVSSAFLKFVHWSYKFGLNTDQSPVEIKVDWQNRKEFNGMGHLPSSVLDWNIILPDRTTNKKIKYKSYAEMVHWSLSTF